jgi:hypothetical protein
VFRSGEGFHGYARDGFADLAVLRTNGINSFLSMTAVFLHGYLVSFHAFSPQTENCQDQEKT